ncbi:PREDICTED: type I inositol polyphosphate 5-phosphatase 4-like isoform X2 [Nelumbo nucifera]|uniref:Type I inositol polyphosphate 5-phosphatase 4-like isoform X2 n=1 Tax=Nelumbo nucifera TaxID=4432 RepID=A0A1U8AZD8_NELNU|nr:PREDICTED: type I inositol polyphosphate 5-phosphatase 4-like isoform X2 [Nelumbo nucifera]
MDLRDRYAPPGKLRNWLKWKKKGESRFHTIKDSDCDDDDDDSDYSDDSIVNSLEKGSCVQTTEFRVFVGTWNVAGRSPVGSLAVDLDDWLNLNDPADIYVLGFQEVVPLKVCNVIGAEDATVETKWNSLIGKTLNNKLGSPWLTPMLHPISSDNYYYGQVSGSESRTTDRVIGGTRTPVRDRRSSLQQEEPADGVSSSTSKYKLMASKKMVGVFISVWMRGDLVKKYRVSNVKVCSVACGIMGYLGNKGSVSVSMSIEGTSFCFIAAHLASGEKKGDETRRNYQVSEIFRRTSFPRLHHDRSSSHPLTILGHECDRILWYGKGVRQLFYHRSESRFSDHRPVSALFSTQIEVVKSMNPKFTMPSFLTETGQGKGKGRTTLLSLMAKDIEAPPPTATKDTTPFTS